MLIIRQASVCETPNYEGLNTCRNLVSAAHKPPLLFGKMRNEFDFHLLALRLERQNKRSSSSTLCKSDSHLYCIASKVKLLYWCNLKCTN
jgi:hypothetical protein